jgi:hypothetical protein
MASLDKEIEEFFSRLIGNEEEQDHLVDAVRNGRATQWATDEGIGTCGYSDLNAGMLRYARTLPARQGGPIIEAIQNGSQAVTIDGRSFPMPTPGLPPAQQAASYVNMVNQTTNNIDMSRDTINNINAIGSNVNVDQQIASGDGSNAIGRDNNAPITQGDGNITAATGGGDFAGSTGGGDVTDIDNSNLAGTNFGAGGTAVAAGGDAAVAGGEDGRAVGAGGVGGDVNVNVADNGGTIADGGSVAAGGLAGNVGTAAAGGGNVDQSVEQTVDQSVDQSTTQLAGGDIDQSTDVDVDVAQADTGGVALADQVDMSDPMS